MYSLSKYSKAFPIYLTFSLTLNFSDSLFAPSNIEKKEHTLRVYTIQALTKQCLSYSIRWNMLKCNEQYATLITTSFRVILFLLCATFVIHRGYECFKKYMDAPESIDLSYKFTGSDEIPFPSFTFCPIRYLFIY